MKKTMKNKFGVLSLWFSAVPLLYVCLIRQVQVQDFLFSLVLRISGVKVYTGNIFNADTSDILDSLFGALVIQGIMGLITIIMSVSLIVSIFLAKHSIEKKEEKKYPIISIVIIIVASVLILNFSMKLLGYL